MNDDLIDLVTQVFVDDDLVAPRFGPSTTGSFAVISFIRDTLASQVHHQNRQTSSLALNASFNRKLLAQVTGPQPVGLPHLLIAKLKSLLSRSATFERTPERRVVSCALLYALRLKPRIPVSDIELLLELFSDASLVLRPNEASDDFWSSSRLVMFSTLQALLPEESNERAAENTDESLLESLAASSALAHYFQGTPDISDSMRLVLQFAYVLLQMRCSSRTTQVDSQERLDDCYRVGVFHALYTVLTDAIFTQGISEADQILCFEISYRLLTMLFEVENRRIVSKRHVLHEATRNFLKRTNDDRKCDDYRSLMQCLALIFSHCPNVIVKPDSEQARCFVAWLPESGFMQISSPLLTAYIDLISALAHGEDGSERIFTQMTESARNQFSVTNDGFRYICWDFVLESLLMFCRVLTGTGPKGKALVRDEEFEGFTAYMRLFGKLFCEGSIHQTEQRVQLLESEFKSVLHTQKLQDLFLIIFCKSVPNFLKAASCKALMGISQTPESALRLLNNLKHVGLFASDHDSRRYARYRVQHLAFAELMLFRKYLQLQLATVEAQLQDYSFTISCIEMVNQLLMKTGKLQDRETALVEVTTYCKDVVLDAIWNHLCFMDPAQLWDLLSIMFKHFQICLIRIDLEEFESTTEKKSPSQLILHDVLGKGAIYKALCSCISKAFVERSSNRFPENAANRALCNALDLVLTIFDKEQQVQHPPQAGYPAFKASILENKSLSTVCGFFMYVFADVRDFVQRSLFNVSSGLPQDLQAGSVDLMRKLYGATPEHFDLLDPDFQQLITKELPALFHENVTVT